MATTVVPEHLRAEIGGLRKDQNALRVALAELCDSHAELCNHLAENGVLSAEHLLARLHRWRFSAVRWAHPCALEASLPQAISMTGPALATARFLGPQMVCVLHAACRALIGSMPDAAYPKKLYVCGGFDGRVRLSCVERFDPELGMWEVLPSMSQQRVDAVASVIYGHLYICGGLDGDRQCLNSVERLDPTTRTGWESVTPMVQGRAVAMAAVMRGYLYVCGGADNQKFLASAERLDPKLGSWESLPPMMDRRQDGAAAVMSSESACRLYVCGGDNGGSECLRSAEALDVFTGSWHSLPQMAEGRVDAIVKAIRGRLYVCGGLGSNRESLKSLERYDPDSNTWELLPAMAQPRAGSAGAVLNGRLYICGGFNEQGCLNAVERFDPSDDQWETLKPMSQRRQDAIVATIGGKLYICGGDDAGQVCLQSLERFDPCCGAWESLCSMHKQRNYAAWATVRA